MPQTRLPVALRVPGTLDRAYAARFLVDGNASDSMAPASELTSIGVVPVGAKSYELAEGVRIELAYGIVQIEFLNEVTAGRVIFGPEGTEPILGLAALESASLTVHPTTGALKRLPLVPPKGTSLRLPAAPPSDRPVRRIARADTMPRVRRAGPTPLSPQIRPDRLASRR